MSDFSKRQPAPQTRENSTVEFNPDEAQLDRIVTPTTGFDDGIRVGLADTAAGPGVPPSNRKIH